MSEKIEPTLPEAFQDEDHGEGHYVADPTEPDGHKTITSEQLRLYELRELAKQAREKLEKNLAAIEQLSTVEKENALRQIGKIIRFLNNNLEGTLGYTMQALERIQTEKRQKDSHEEIEALQKRRQQRAEVRLQQEQQLKEWIVRFIGNEFDIMTASEYINSMDGGASMMPMPEKGEAVFALVAEGESRTKRFIKLPIDSTEIDVSALLKEFLGKQKKNP